MGKIIWLASYPKSGNTWLRAFLANLFTGAETPVDINALDRFCPSLTARTLYDAAAGAPTQALPEPAQLALRGAVQRGLCANIPESAFVKTHSRFGAAMGLPLIDPACTVGAIYIVRDPLDVAVSAADHFGVSAETMVRHMADVDFRTAPSAQHVTDYVGAWSAHVASWTVPAHPKIHVMRYEDVHAAPQAAFARLLDFLGLNASEAQLARAVQFSQFDTLAGQERAAGFKERTAHAAAFFRRGRPGAGRETLPPALIEAILAAHGAQMARFGYA